MKKKMKKREGRKEGRHKPQKVEEATARKGSAAIKPNQTKPNPNENVSCLPSQKNM